MVELERRTFKSEISKNIRSFEITDGEVIELKGITYQQWAIYEPLLNALRATRIQSESGEVEITPIPYQEVKSFFPENTSWQDIKKHYRMLNKALDPSRWSIDRKEQLSRKPIGTPWFLRGPDDNGVQNKGQPKPNQQNIFDRTVSEDKKQIAMKRFDPLAFGTKLLHSCLSNLTNPEAKKIFTKDLRQFMPSCLPADLKLDHILGDKTPQECFQEVIKDAINNMVGKRDKELTMVQQKILPFWNKLEDPSGQHLSTVIFERFGIQPNPNKSS